MQSKTITIRMPDSLLQHCKRRINEMNLIHDMDISKFIRWLIKRDLQQYQPSVQQGNTDRNTTTDNIIPQKEIQKPRPKTLDWSHLK